MPVNPVKTFQKDPNELLDYTMDWSDWLAGDKIATVSWTIPGGISSAGQMNSVSSTTIWLSGGTDGTSYDLSCLITTTGVRTAERTMRISVVER